MQKNESEQKKYEPYVETLKSFKENLPKTVQYQIINSENNITEVNVSCSFDYYDNSITNLQKMARLELFDINIKDSTFLANDIKRFITPDNKDKVEILINIYKHVNDFLSEAKDTLLINGEMVEST
jgi:hypothetical protein